MQRISLIQPDDWHLHVRDGAVLAGVVSHTARQFARAIIMPNLKPPVTTVESALAYRQRILAVVPEGGDFEPLMTLYLTEFTPLTEVQAVAASSYVHAFKLYPAGATTHSEAGVVSLSRIYPLLEAMEKWDVPLLVHGEVTDPDIDIFDRESVFIDKELYPIAQRFSGLRIVFEHLTTREGVEFVRAAGPNVAGTITAHHLLYNRNSLLSGGIRPHFYCLPVLKREMHRQALIGAATGGEDKFFLGTDSAPHPKGQKESSCGCAGCYTAHAALELYAAAFEAAGRLDYLEKFASLNGPRFYRMPVNPRHVTLEKNEWRVPSDYPLGDDNVVPLGAGEMMAWKLLG